MREAVVSYARYPQNKWRCVTELGIPIVSEQRLVDTSRVFEILSAPGVTYKTEDLPVFIGERAIRQAMRILGIVEHDAAADLEKDCRIAELEAENDRLQQAVDAVYVLKASGFRPEAKRGPKPKQKVEAA